jgi:transposase InsO family protein
MVQAKSEAVKAYWTQWSSLILRDNVLYKKFLNSDGFTIDLQILLPQLLRAEFTRQFHNGRISGHLGPSKTRDQVQRRAYWCGWRKDVELFFRRCEPCCRYHRGPPPCQGHLQSLGVGMPMERLHIDLTGSHPRSRQGYQYILTCIDPFTKFAETIAIRDKTARTVAKALTEQVFCRYGVPLALMSDLGREFENETMYEICRLLQVDKLRSTAYKTSTNGVVERLHRTLNSMLGKVVKKHQKDWCEHLPSVMAANRATRHNSTQFSPNLLTFGREVRAPIDIVLGRPEGEDSLQSSDDYADDLIERQRKAYILVHKQLGTAAERTIRYYEMKVKPVTFAVGDWVWVYNSRRYAGRSPKWNRAYEGPFLVEEVLGPANFVVRKSRRAKPRIVHIDKLNACLNESRTIPPETIPPGQYPPGQFPPEVIQKSTCSEIGKPGQITAESIGSDTMTSVRIERPRLTGDCSQR